MSFYRPTSTLNAISKIYYPYLSLNIDYEIIKGHLSFMIDGRRTTEKSCAVKMVNDILINTETKRNKAPYTEYL